MTIDDRSPAQKFQAILDLYEFGVEMMKMNLKREHPTASPEELELLLRQWLLSRPGAEFGDAEGRPVSWPRSSK